MALFRTIARHGMTKGAAFAYAVVVGAAANFVIDYVHRHEDNVTPVVAHETAAPAAPEHDRAVAPIARPEPHTAEPRIEREQERPATASLPPVREVRPLPPPVAPVALPQVPTLPSSADLPTPALKPAAVPSISAPPAVPDRPVFNVPPAGPAAASVVPPVDKPADKPVEAMSKPAPPIPSVGNPISLLPPPDPPPTPAIVKPASGTGGLY